MVLVALILLAFLGDLRASPLSRSLSRCLSFTFIMMVLRGDSANLISMEQSTSNYR
jgi:Cu/Ag efflux pump CusA